MLYPLRHNKTAGLCPAGPAGARPYASRGEKPIITPLFNIPLSVEV